MKGYPREGVIVVIKRKKKVGCVGGSGTESSYSITIYVDTEVAAIRPVGFSHDARAALSTSWDTMGMQGEINNTAEASNYLVFYFPI